MQYLSHYFIAATWYQTVALYALIAGIAYANIFLIRLGERKKAGVGGRRG